MAALLVALAAVTVWLYPSSPRTRPGEGPARKARQTTGSAEENAPASPARTASSTEGSGTSVESPAPSPQTLPTLGQTGTEAGTAESLIAEVESSLEGTEPLPIPAAADEASLRQLSLPPLPYSIYAGAFKSVEEAQTTQREHVSNYLPGYILPIEVKGEIAQSLFGVTQDGAWYAVLIGHFASKDAARKTLGRMMKDRAEGQPEIMQFPYALECGRTLEETQSLQLADRLSQAGFFPYTQDYPVEDGRVLTRVMVGCHFSEIGASPLKDLLEQKGFSSCRADLR